MRKEIFGCPEENIAAFGSRKDNKKMKYKQSLRILKCLAGRGREPWKGITPHPTSLRILRLEHWVPGVCDRKDVCKKDKDVLPRAIAPSFGQSDLRLGEDNS